MFAGISINHVSGTDILKNFDLNSDTSQEFLNSLKEQGIIKNGFTVNTCNRFELYYLAPNNRSSDIVNALHKHLGLNKNYAEHFRNFNGDEALRHMINVAVGADSRLIGETSIAGQMDNFLKISAENGLKLKNIQKLIEKTVKDVRNETGFYNGLVTEGGYISQLLSERPKSLTDWMDMYHSLPEDLIHDITKAPLKPLIIGTSYYAMESILPDILKNPLFMKNPDNVTLTSPNASACFSERAAKQIVKTGVKWLDYKELSNIISQSGVIIMATSIDKKKDGTNIAINSTLAKAVNPGTIVIDLARDGSTTQDTKEILIERGVQIINLDEIQKTLQKDAELRIAESGKVQSIIERNLSEFKKIIKHPCTNLCQITCKPLTTQPEILCALVG